MTATKATTRRTTRHELKLWTDQFVAMQLGIKRADVRRCDDREFRRGDELLFRDFASGKYSGMALLARVTHLTRAAGTLDLYGALNEGKTTDGMSFPIVVLSVEVLEIGRYVALVATAVGALPASSPPHLERCTCTHTRVVHFGGGVDGACMTFEDTKRRCSCMGFRPAQLGAQP